MSSVQIPYEAPQQVPTSLQAPDQVQVSPEQLAQLQRATQVPTPGPVPGVTDDPFADTAVKANEILHKGKSAAVGALASAGRAQDRATQAGLEAAGSERDQQLATAKAEIPIYKQRLADLTAQQGHLSEVMAKATAQKDDALNRTLAAADDLKNTHIYNWWAQAGTGATILGVISQALAGGLQGLTGSSGPTALDKVIEQDLQVQKLNYQQKSDVAQQSRSLYGQLMDNLKDTVMVESAMRDIAYNSTLERLKSVAGTLGMGKVKSQYDAMVAQVTQKLADNKLNLDKDLSQTLMSEAITNSGHAITLQGQWGALEASKMDNAAKLANQGQQYGILGIKNSGGLAKAIGPEKFAEFKGRWDSVPLFFNDAKKVKEILASPIDAPEKAAQLNAIFSELKTRIGKIQGLGALAAEDLKITEGQIGTAGAWTALAEGKLPGLRTEAQIAAAIQRLAENARTKMIGEVNSYTTQGIPLQVDKDAWANQMNQPSKAGATGEP